MTELYSPEHYFVLRNRHETSTLLSSSLGLRCCSWKLSRTTAASKPTGSRSERTSGTDMAKGGPPSRSPIGKTAVRSSPPGASSARICSAQRPRAAGLSAQRKLQSQMRSYWLRASRAKKSAHTTSTLEAAAAAASASPSPDGSSSSRTASVGSATILRDAFAAARPSAVAVAGGGSTATATLPVTRSGAAARGSRTPSRRTSSFE
mmetsp:Transcript_26714/g.85679  ORF Transcript_26714/g.85679 Transcript_26714/m.85679 type:complete len:206 (-) Transcript_26714:376-993(-)